MPELSGRRFLVTGVTSGIGKETARELAGHGASVLLAARNPDKLARTRAELEADSPPGNFTELIVDLADLSSVRAAAERVEGPVDVLINNAGVMAPPYSVSPDGFELQMATNHFGPFLLTGLLLDRLVASGAGRVVTVASLAHRMTRAAALGDPLVHGRYSRWDSYAKSKLANLLFSYELDRRLAAKRLPVKALAAHPGFTSTELVRAGRADERRAAIMQGVFGLVGQEARVGAWPTLLAATGELPGSTYVGPGGTGQLAGPPRVVDSNRLSRDHDVAAEMWRLSEEATGIIYP